MGIFGLSHGGRPRGRRPGWLGVRQGTCIWIGLDFALIVIDDRFIDLDQLSTLCATLAPVDKIACSTTLALTGGGRYSLRSGHGGRSIMNYEVLSVTMLLL